jgi:phosphonate transport system substrate-binding protein
MAGVVLLGLLLAPRSVPAQARPLVFAPLPMESRETVVKQFMPMAAYLRQATGREVVFDISDGYDQVLDKFRRGGIDLAYMGPLPYVALRNGYGAAVPLVHFNEPSGEPFYTCALITQADKADDFARVERRRIALTQPLSTCGYLSTSGLLRERGADLAKNLYRYLNKHDAVAMAVVRGEFDLGGLKTSIARKYAHLGLAVLAETRPLPSFALVGNAETLTAGDMAVIRDAMSRLDPAGSDRNMVRGWGDNIRHGAVPARDEDYAPVRDLLGGQSIPETGNY